MTYSRFAFSIAVLFLSCSTLAAADQKTYVGSKACKECHEAEYQNYFKFSKKASSYDSIRIMESKLTKEEFRSCFECHTTGYGQPGGFVSEKQTPELKNAGCESCHGPGSVHAASSDPDDIRASLTLEDCNHCHSSDRVEAFDFKPLLFGGAH
ncbi:MAG: cytochrome c family protein [Pseudomonadota bacterium]